ncbi:MAG: 50S ribosome-binding GTPase [Planctomycetes bacterium]|nr:50S ribosome-binding GTPase [Planctomycetota bacterium]
MTEARVVRLTSAGIGGIGVLLIAGDGAEGLLRGIAPIPRPGRARYGRILRDGRLIDEVLVLSVDPGDSPTGEPAYEITTHGGPQVMAEILELLIACGATPIDRTELRALARRGGRLDAIAEDALALLERARTARAARFYLEALGGSLRAELERLRDIRAVKPRIDALETLLRRARLPFAFADPPRVVLLGPPNAGKSSLLNRLAGRPVAIVDPEPGTTRDVIEAEISIAGVPVLVTDGAGVRESTSPIEAEGVRRILQAARAASAVLVLSEVGERFPDLPPRAIPVRTKADLDDPPESGSAPLPPGAVRTSALTGEGIADLERRILEHLVGEAPDPPDPPAPFTPRQVRAVEAALAASRGAGGLDAIERLLIECAGPCAGSVGTEGRGEAGTTHDGR